MTKYTPDNFTVLLVWRAKDGTPMQANLHDVIAHRPDGDEVVRVLTACDGNSSPFLAKWGRLAAIFHDPRFFYCRGWWAANKTLFRDMRDGDGRSIFLAGAFFLVLTIYPLAYIRHWLRRRFGLFRGDEARKELPKGALEVSVAVRHAMRKLRLDDFRQ